MIAANLPIQRSAQAKLLVVDCQGNIRHWVRSKMVDLLRRGDLVIANDAATLPASLAGEHLQSRRAIEVRLVGMSSLEPGAIRNPTALVFGAGDFRVRTEDRPMPPQLAVNDQLVLG